MKEQRRSLGFLFLGIFLNRFGSFVAIFLVFYLLAKGYTVFQAGLAVSLFGAGNIVASVVGGQLADQLGRRTSIVLSMFSSAGVMLLLSQVAFLPLLLVCVACAGFASALFRPAAGALVADLTTPETRVKTYALSRLAINLGAALGPAVAAVLVSHSYFWLFVGDALTSILFGMLALFALPNNRRTRQQEQKAEQVLQDPFFRAFLRDRQLLLFLGASLVMALVYFQSESTFAFHIRAAGLSSAVYGLLLSLNGGIIILVEWPLSTITQRFPVRPVVALGLVLIGLGFGLTAFAPTFLLLAGTVIIWTFGEMIYHAPAASYVAGLAPDHLQGRYQGAFDTIWSIAICAAPLLGSLAFTWNAQGFWMMCGGGVMVAALLWLLLSSQKGHVKEEAPRAPLEEHDPVAVQGDAIA